MYCETTEKRGWSGEKVIAQVTLDGRPDWMKVRGVGRLRLQGGSRQASNQAGVQETNKHYVRLLEHEENYTQIFLN